MYWEREGPVLNDHVRRIWNNNLPLQDLGNVASNLKNMMKSLHDWSRNHIGSVPRKLEWVRKRVHLLYRQNQIACSTCTICGCGEEDVFHALIVCPKARTLRLWNLPGEELFKFEGPDWLSILLDKLDIEGRAKLLILFWRTWHLRNNLIFGDGKGSIWASVIFLENMWSC